jgi:hypothetical protein
LYSVRRSILITTYRLYIRSTLLVQSTVLFTMQNQYLSVHVVWTVAHLIYDMAGWGKCGPDTEYR